MVKETEGETPGVGRVKLQACGQEMQWTAMDDHGRSTEITGLGKSTPSRARAAIACRCSSVLFMSTPRRMCLRSHADIISHSEHARGMGELSATTMGWNSGE